MKIENSHVNMASSHNSYSYTHLETVTIERRANVDSLGAIMRLSEDGEKSYKEAVKQYEKEEEQSRKEQQQKNMQNSLKKMIEHDEEVREANRELSQWEFEDLEISIVKKILAVLNGEKLDPKLKKQLNNWKKGMLNLCKDDIGDVKFSVNGIRQNTLNLASTESVSRTQIWQRITAISPFLRRV